MTALGGRESRLCSSEGPPSTVILRSSYRFWIRPPPRGGSMSQLTEAGKVDLAALADLERSFHGQIVRQGDAQYEAVRAIWNGSIDRFPALIARCADVADVVAAVRFGRRTG